MAIRKFFGQALATCRVSRSRLSARRQDQDHRGPPPSGVVIGKKDAEIDSQRQEAREGRQRPVYIEASRSRAPSSNAAPHRAVRCRAARGTRCDPPCDAQGRPSPPARAAPRASASRAPPVSAVARDDARRECIAKVACRCKQCVQDRLRVPPRLYDEGLHRRAGVGSNTAKCSRQKAPQPRSRAALAPAVPANNVT